MDAQSTQRTAVLASKVLIGTAGTIAGQWEKFTGWLVAGLGASLALIIANMDKTKDMLPAASVSQAVKIFIALLLVHTVQKILAFVVASAVDADQKEVIAKASPPLNQQEAIVMLDHIEESYFFPFSCMIHGAFGRIRKGELIHVGRRIIRFALASTLLAAMQVLLAVWAVSVIARGLV